MSATAAEDYPYLAELVKWDIDDEPAKVLAEVDYLRAVESAARYLMTAPNRAVEENAHSVLYCALKLCGPDGCVNCREGA